MNKEEVLAELANRTSWVLCHVLVTMQELKELGLINGPDVDPELPAIVKEARGKYGHASPTPNEVAQTVNLLQGGSDSPLAQTGIMYGKDRTEAARKDEV